MRDRLPPNVTPQMGPISSIMGQVLMVALTGPDTVSPMEMREIAEFVVRPRLLTIPGVAQVIPMGGEVRQYRVSPNPAAMRALGVTLEQIERALQAFGTNTGGGFADQYSREFLIRNVGRTLKLEDLAALVVGVSREAPIRLDQVAEVGYGARLKRGDAGFMGKPAVVLSIEKQPDIDTLRLTAELESALRIWRRPFLLASRRITFSSGRRTSLRPRLRTSRRCCWRRWPSWPSCCSCFC